MKKTILLSIFITGCGTDLKLDVPPERKPTAIQISTEAYKPAYESYTYKGSKYPDPFMPTTVGAGYILGEYTFEPNTAQLVGIIKSKDGDIAVLSIGGGVSFLLKNGRLYDPKRKEVKGYIGLIQGKSVKIIDQNKIEYVYNLR
ncbi:MAG: hypothetical protein NZ870_03210 [bacterium]|nr:hypothetical protein [bacterium]